VAARNRARKLSVTNAGRVIGGTARGVRLIGPGGQTRPLSDRLKQSLFAILEPTIRGRAFLDLFAGSGAAGIEALSRGASKAMFVERDPDAVHAIERNLEAAGLAGSAARVSDSSVDAWLAIEGGRAARHDARAEGPFAAVMIDPPYDAPVELDWALEGIAEGGRGGVLETDGVAVAKHFWKAPPAGNRLLRSFREERFGETMLTFFRWAEEVDS
jgi:16S rRNA (guanine966-N2)-methyltransferase